MHTIEVRIPGATTSVLQLKGTRGGVDGMIAECQRRLRMHIPMTLCSAEEDGLDLALTDELEPLMYLVPRFPKGTRIRAQGMLKAPELNGKEGKVLVEKGGRYGVVFDDGTKGLLSGVNIAAIDEKGEAAQEALKQLLSMQPREANDDDDAGVEVEVGPTEEEIAAAEAEAEAAAAAAAAAAARPKKKKVVLPRGPMARDAQVDALARLRGEFVDLSEKNAVGILTKHAWDLEAARTYLLGGNDPTPTPVPFDDDHTAPTAHADSRASKKKTKDATVAAPPPTRDEQKRLLQEALDEYPTLPQREVGRVLIKAGWDLAKARVRLEKMKAKAEARDGVGDDTTTPPAKRAGYAGGASSTLAPDVASGGADNPGLRRMERDLTVGGAGGDDAAADENISYACRKCRTPMCSSADVKFHDPTSDKGKKEFKAKHGAVRWTFSKCGSIFLEEGCLPWVEAQTVDLKGDLFCPNDRCKWKVGSYNWTGQQCSCGVWVNPAIQLQHSKMDRFAAGADAGAGADGSATNTPAEAPLE